jgi:electron transfer flavoprotein alpha/beta subunit
LGEESSDKIAICIKPVPDPGNLTVSKSKNTIIEGGKKIINPYDLPAIAAAIKISRQTIAIMVGTSNDIQVLRKALSFGIGEGLLIEHETRDSLVTARLLIAVIRRGRYNVIFTGARSPFGMIGQVPARIATELSFRLVDDPSQAQSGTIVKVPEFHGNPPLPRAVDIMQAFKKPVGILRDSELNVDLKPTIETKAEYLV